MTATALGIVPPASPSVGSLGGTVESRGLGSKPSEPTARPRVAVLIVDDERLVGTALARALRDEDVTVVCEAQDVLALLAAGRRFDVILSDVTMPAMSGVSLYRELTRRHPDAAARVIFMTGGVMSPADRAFLEGVSNPMMDKPFGVRAVRSMIESFAPRLSGARAASGV